MNLGLLKTSDGSEITLTQDMLEDFHILSSVYKVPVKDLVEQIFDAKLEPNT